MAMSKNTNSDKKFSRMFSDPIKGFDNKEKLLTKVVIRRLPPSMTSETFLDQVSPIPDYDYFYMVKGDANLRENQFCRAYINFVNPSDVYDFKEKFDNYVFLDNAGLEYPAVVEYAAFQKIPKRRNKVRVDPKAATIESDPYYLEFLEIINKRPEPSEKPEYSYQITTENKNVTSTPLLDYVKNKRVEKMRVREERKRKEFERKKFRDNEGKKWYEEKSLLMNKGHYSRVVTLKEKTTNLNKEIEKTEGEKKLIKEKLPEKDEPEKYENRPVTSYYKNREKIYDDRRKDSKGKYSPKKDYVEKREFKSRRNDYNEYKDREYKDREYKDRQYKDREYQDREYRPKDRYEKEDPRVYEKNVKKYTEKIEERKIVAQKRLEQQQETTPKSKDQPKENPNKKENTVKNEKNEEALSKSEKSIKVKENEGQSERRIRNKHRPTIAIYRPGMFSKRLQNEGDNNQRENRKD